MSQFGVAIITLNEERKIKKCLESIQFADEIVVVDSFSSDKTVEIAKQSGAIVFQQEFLGFSKQKQMALDHLNTEWKLVLDADEWVSDELLTALKGLSSKASHDVYELERWTLFMGKELRYGKGLDFTVRLFRGNKAKFDGRPIHESLVTNRPIGRLPGAILHDSAQSIDERLNTVKRDIEGEVSVLGAHRTSCYKLFVRPLLFFFTQLIWNKAWKDGLPGLIHVGIFSFQYFLIEAKAHEGYLEKDFSS